MQATISTDDITATFTAPGWTSYRYASRYGYIMIGATSTQDALNEADRSLTQGAATVERLEIWNALTGLYEKVKE